MKKLIVVLISIFLLSCTVHKIEVKTPEKGQYTYEGMVDPQVIVDTWKEIKTVQIATFWFETYYRNPNNSICNYYIPVAMLVRYYDGIVYGYAYLFNSESYMFFLEDGCYKYVKFTKENRKYFKQNLLNALDGKIL